MTSGHGLMGGPQDSLRTGPPETHLGSLFAGYPQEI